MWGYSRTRVRVPPAPPEKTKSLIGMIRFFCFLSKREKMGRHFHRSFLAGFEGARKTAKTRELLGKTLTVNKTADWRYRTGDHRIICETRGALS